MRVRKILQGFSTLALSLGLSCTLNPQPEPPLQGLSRGSNDSPGPGSGGAIITTPEDAGVVVPKVSDGADASAELPDSSSTSDGSGGDAGAIEAETEGGNEDAITTVDTGGDAIEEPTTTAD
jgi:hypothetical protein